LTEESRRIRNHARLAECDTVAAARIRELITLMERDEDLFRPRIQEAWRSLAKHQADLAAGTSTSAWSQHMATGPHGEQQALAVDLLEDDYPVPQTQVLWPARFRRYVLKLAYYAPDFTLQTGILWRLKPLPRRALHEAIRAERWSYPGPIGFDPTHVEVADVSYEDAEQGVRPHAE